MNELTLYGRLTRDPDLEFAKTGNAVARATIAVNHGKDKVTFIPVKAFGKTAEVLAEYVKKGHRVLIKGHIQTNVAEVKGQKKMYLDIVIDHLHFVETKEKEETKEK